MSVHPINHSESSLRRFNERMQLSRAAVFGLAYLITLVLIPVHLVRVHVLPGTVLLLIAEGTALVGYRIASTRLGSRLGANLSMISLFVDGVLITLLISFDGGASSLFVIWYVSNIAAATFTTGFSGTYRMMLFDAACYLGILALQGQIGILDASFVQSVGRLLFLFGASYFAFRGIAQARDKRMFVKQLQAEEKLKVEALTRLTQELDEQSKQLASANVQIQQANRLKSQFLATMSHELRTPLNSVLGFANILEHSMSGRATDKELRFLGNILKSGEHLLNLINDLLDLSKIEAGRMEVNPEEFDVGKALSGIRDVMRGTSSPRSIEIELDVDEGLSSVRIDHAKFKQIAFNLLSNAVKFSSDRSLISVRAYALAPGDSPLGTASLCVEVEDQGIGIAAMDQEIIFEEFRQAEDGFVRQYGGTGLGLTLVRRFVEIQGGIIDLRSEIGVGSTFRVVLPMEVEPVAIAKFPVGDDAATVAETDERRRILVVEDDPVAFAKLSAILEQESFVAIRARRGEDVTELVRRENPVLITLDLVLPGLDGWDVLRALKSNDATREIPIVIVTILENQELGLALGADDYFVKPIDTAAFVSSVNGLTSPDAVHGPSGIDVMVVDDEEEVFDLVTQMLVPLGYRVTGVTNGREAIMLARNRPPAVIVLDLLMPGMNGFEVAMTLQSDKATSRIPIIVLTGKELDAEDRTRLEGRIVALFEKRPESRRGFIDAVRDAAERGAKRASNTP